VKKKVSGVAYRQHHDINKVDTQNHMLTFIIGGAASLGVAFGLMAMFVELSYVTYVAFAFPLLTAPAIIVQRRKIQWLPSKYYFAMINDQCTCL
jgi:hypothetical protein